MPNLKQVRKLCDICASCFNKAMLDFFEHVNTFSDSVPDTLILNMRYTFIGNVQDVISEKLLHEIDDSMKLQEFQKLMLIKLYKHPHLKRFNLRFKLPCVAGFYEHYFKDLNKLVVLNLTKVCTDEILEIVGENCPLLEVIYIISKTESVSNKNGKELNALKLKFFVSDAGLKFLHKCKRLKKIFMDKIIRSCCGGRKITHNGLRSLLYSLPSIHYISYEDIGTVLEGWTYSQNLSLIHVHDNHITPEHISLFNFLCPSVKTLCLSIPTVVRDPQVSYSCLQRLTNSDLSIKSLVLKSFPFHSSLQDYLDFKGEYLTTLSLDHESSINTQSLFTIAIKCKNMEHLAVKLLYPSDSDTEIMQRSEITKCFTTLRSVKLFGIKWKPNIIFPLCVYNAKNLETISLFNKYFDENLDETFEILLTKNSLSYLTKLTLLDGFIMSSTALVNFVLSCKILKEVTFKVESGYDNLFEEVIAKNNLDLTIKTENIANYGYCLCQNY